MATRYVKSGSTGGANNGTSWADAYLLMSTMAASDTVGDIIYVSNNHAESSGSAQSIALAGTAASPSQVICANDGAAPPTATATTATVTTTGTNSITITGSGYVYGINFSAGTTSSSATNLLIIGTANGDNLSFDTCSFAIANTNASAYMQFGSGSQGSTSALRFNNVSFRFANTSQTVRLYRNIKIIGGGIISGSSAVSTLFNILGESVIGYVRDFDMSNLGSSLNLIQSSASSNAQITFLNCKLPASWSGGVVAGAPTNTGFRASMYNCDSGATNYRLWIETYAGNIKSETTLVKTGGASDGTTALSWKLTTTANANETVAPLITDDMAIWIDSTGSSKTITVDILHDSTTALTDAEVWLEIDYLGSSAQPLGTPASDKRATVLTTAENQTTSSATWTTTGMTSPNKQKLEVTFTPQMKGFVYARVCLAKASYTIYVDPEPVIS